MNQCMCCGKQGELDSHGFCSTQCDEEFTDMLEGAQEEAGQEYIERLMRNQYNNIEDARQDMMMCGL